MDDEIRFDGFNATSERGGFYMIGSPGPVIIMEPEPKGAFRLLIGGKLHPWGEPCAPGQRIEIIPVSLWAPPAQEGS